jgi:hypothetical protein
MAKSEYTGSYPGTEATLELINACQAGLATLVRYTNAHAIPFLIATNYFNRVERQRFWTRTPVENFMAYLKIGTMNLELAGRALSGGFQAVEQFLKTQFPEALSTVTSGDLKSFHAFAGNISNLVEGVAHTYPSAIDNIESEFGFHFERQPATSKIDETQRFELYQVLPDDPKVKVRPDGKPILIIPPFVLGANILAFLPAEKRSYAHAYANQGIPTYIRVLKDIQTSEAVQVMTPEDDAKDTIRFCEAIMKRHGAAVTLNGYCQGGYSALCNILSGKLDGLVDALITCVSPMDGTRSKGLSEFLENLPQVFNDLDYGTKELPNGNRVADGTLMGWIYKLKSIESEMPLLAMWRDMMLVSHINGDPTAISKTAAALNHWLLYQRNDLPLEITRVSFASYNTPVTKDGTLPVKLFGQKLNLHRIAEKKIPWLICYGLNDDLVEPETALAPLDHIDVEVAPFPKGHVAIATSWSHPESAYALHNRFADGKYRGPVCFQLDLQKQIDSEKKVASEKPRSKSTRRTKATKAAPKRSKQTPKTRKTKSTTPKKKEAKGSDN